MAKETKEVEVQEEKKDARQLAWESFLAKYQKSNPAKYELKLAKGDLSKIPDSFIG